MDNLRECPFCENSDIKLFYWEEAMVWKLECLVCHVTFTHVDKSRLIKLWNNRVKEDELSEKLKEAINSANNSYGQLVLSKQELELWKNKYKDIETRFNGLAKEVTVLKNESRIKKDEVIDLQTKYNLSEITVKQLKQNIQENIVSYSAIRNKHDELQGEVDRLKKELQRVSSIAYGTNENNKTLYELNVKELEKENVTLKEKINNLEERTRTLLIIQDDLKGERDIFKGQIKTAEENMKIASVRQNELEEKIEDLETKLEADKETAKLTVSILKNKIEDERKAHQYYIDSMQTRLNIAEEALRNVISYKDKMELGSAERYKIAVEALEKIADKK